jgi:hypothetical protein
MKTTIAVGLVATPRELDKADLDFLAQTCAPRKQKAVQGKEIEQRAPFSLGGQQASENEKVETFPSTPTKRTLKMP